MPGKGCNIKALVGSLLKGDKDSEPKALRCTRTFARVWKKFAKIWGSRYSSFLNIRMLGHRQFPELSRGRAEILNNLSTAVISNFLIIYVQVMTV